MIYIYLFHNERFYFVRNMFMVAMGIALIGYVLYPTAPAAVLPELGFMDTVSDFTGVDHNDVKVNALFNPYAAVPSMHCCNALLIGWSLAQMCTWRPAKVFWAVYPLILVWTVVATGNHWILDAVLGAATAAVSFYAARWLAQKFAPKRGPSRPPKSRLQNSLHMSMPPSSRERRELVRNRLIESRLTPNAISLTGFVLCVVAAVLDRRGPLLPRRRRLHPRLGLRHARRPLLAHVRQGHAVRRVPGLDAGPRSRRASS